MADSTLEGICPMWAFSYSLTSPQNQSSKGRTTFSPQVPFSDSPEWIHVSPLRLSRVSLGLPSLTGAPRER